MTSCQRPHRMSRNERERHLLRIAKYYESGTYHQQSAAGTIYILATVLERVDNDMLWYVNTPLQAVLIHQSHSGLQSWASRINITLPAYLVKNMKRTTLCITTKFFDSILSLPTMVLAHWYLSTQMIQACVQRTNCGSCYSDIGLYMMPCIIPATLPVN